MVIEYQMREGLKYLTKRSMYIALGMGQVIFGELVAFALPEEPDLSRSLIGSGLDAIVGR